MVGADGRVAVDGNGMTGPGRKAVQSRQRVCAPPKVDHTTEVLADLDTQLMLQACAGSRDAANALIRRNFPRIARYIARLIGAQHPVEDLTQDVFLQALSHAGQYRPTAKVITWLFRIATNVSLNYMKQAHVRRRAAERPDGSLEVVDRTAPPPDRQVSLDELKSEVADAVAALPPNQRVAVTLFQYEDCSYEQIAAVLDVTVEAVRSLLMRARTTLRSRLHRLM